MGMKGWRNFFVFGPGVTLVGKSRGLGGRSAVKVTYDPEAMPYLQQRNLPGSGLK